MREKSQVDDEVVEYMAESRKMLQEIQGAEQRQLDQEYAALYEKLLKAQQESEERQFQAIQLQQQVSNQMILQLASTLVNSQHQSSALPSWNTHL